MWRKQTEAQPSPPASQPPVQPPVPKQQSLERSSAPPLAVGPASNTTRISVGITVKGVFSGETDLYVDGDVQGSVNLPDSSVTVGPSGSVTANITARAIFVQGTVLGDLKGREHVLLGRASRVTGDVETDRVVIEDGAFFRGHIHMPNADDGRPARSPAKSQDSSSLRTVPMRDREGLS